MRLPLVKSHRFLIVLTIVLLVAVLLLAIGMQAVLLSSDELTAYQKHIAPFNYQLGSFSWESASELDPDALIVFCISLGATGEVTLPHDGPVDEQYGNPLLDAAVVEAKIQEHFDVSTDFLRSSNYYDGQHNAYFSGGIGSTGELVLERGYKFGSQLTLFYRSSIVSTDYNASWKGKVKILLLDDGGYEYVSFEEYAHKEKYTL